MRIFVSGRSDVGVVDCLALRKVRRHLGIGYAVHVLSCSWARIHKVNQRVVATVVDIGCARIKPLKACERQVGLVCPPGISLLQKFTNDIVRSMAARNRVVVWLNHGSSDKPHQCGKRTMLIGIELGGESILMDKLIVVRHLRVANDFLVTVILFGDHPDVRGSGNVLCAAYTGK